MENTFSKKSILFGSNGTKRMKQCILPYMTLFMVCKFPYMFVLCKVSWNCSQPNSNIFMVVVCLVSFHKIHIWRFMIKSVFYGVQTGSARTFKALSKQLHL